MSTQISKIVDETADQVISLIEQAQDATVSVVTQVSETVSKYVGDLGLKDTFRPEEAVATGFKISTQAVDASRNAALTLLGSDSPAPKKAPAKA
jgi:hypothetical protein